MVGKQVHYVGCTQVQRKAFERRTVPPHNPSGTTPVDAYPLELLLGPHGTGAVVGTEAEAARVRGGAMARELNTGQIYKLAEDAAVSAPGAAV